MASLGLVVERLDNDNHPIHTGLSTRSQLFKGWNNQAQINHYDLSAGYHYQSFELN